MQAPDMRILGCQTTVFCSQSHTESAQTLNRMLYYTIFFSAVNKNKKAFDGLPGRSVPLFLSAPFKKGIILTFGILYVRIARKEI